MKRCVRFVFFQGSALPADPQRQIAQQADLSNRKQTIVNSKSVRRRYWRLWRRNLLFTPGLLITGDFGGVSQFLMW